MALPRKKSRRTPAEGKGGTRVSRHVVLKVIACVVVGLLFMFPALFVNTIIGYFALIAYLFGMIISAVYVNVLKRKMSFVTVGVSGDCVRGQAASFSLKVKNDSFLPAVRVSAVFFMSDIFGGEGARDTHAITLGPRQEKTFDFKIRFEHIGTYQVGISEVVVSDLIGVFSATQHNEELEEVNVQPRVFDITKLPVERDSAIEAKRNFSAVINDGMDYSGVRDYSWGDPIKIIHWKLSARMTEGDYYTRLFETNANPGIAVVADFVAPNYGTEQLMCVYDAIVECAFSLAAYAEENSFDAELLFRSERGEICTYRTPLLAKRQEVLDEMPRVSSSDAGAATGVLQLVQEELKSVFSQTNLIVCASVISEALIETLVSCRSGKRVPLLFAVVPDGIDEEERLEIERLLRRAGKGGVNYTVISEADDLSETLVTGR